MKNLKLYKSKNSGSLYSFNSMRMLTIIWDIGWQDKRLKPKKCWIGDDCDSIISIKIIRYFL